MSAPKRSVAAVLAGVLTMFASASALAALVASDLAEASETPPVEYADDLVAPAPVKMTKVEHLQIAEPALFEPALEMPKRNGTQRRLKFGRFEGY